MVIWKLHLLYFRTTGHKNYAMESVNLVAQSLALLSERDAFRLKWCCWFDQDCYVRSTTDSILEVESR